MVNRRVSINLKEETNIDRINELVAIGIPFSQGSLMTDQNLCLVDEDGNDVPAHFSTLACWPDQSVKWTLAKFLATVSANGERSYFVQQGTESREQSLWLLSKSSSVVQIEKRGDALTFRSPIWRLELARNAPGGFRKFIVGEQELSADNGFVTGRSDNSEFQQGKPEKIEILENNSIRLVLRLSGQFIGVDALDLRYTTILTLSPNSPELRWTQFFHFYGGTAQFDLSHLEGRWHVPSANELHFGEKKINLKPSGSFRLWQKEDLTYDWTNSDEENGTGERSEGCFVWSDGKNAAGFAVRDFWQKSPAMFTLHCSVSRQTCVKPVPSSVSRQTCVKFDFWCGSSRNCSILSSGTSFRHEMLFSLGDDISQLKQGLQAFCHPLAWSIDPAYVCETYALGYLSPEEPRRCPGFENSLRDGLDKLFEQRRNDPSYYGQLNYGDWPMKRGAYGSTWTMYADNEYDAPHVLFMLFARSGRWEYFQAARAGAIHMTDVDTHCATGGMFFHGYSNNAEDHQAHRGNPGEWGHVWADGMLDYYYFTGDITALESAKALGDFCLRGFDSPMNSFIGGHAPIRRIFAGCERAVGWPLITLASLAEATNDQSYLEKAHQMVDYLKHFVNEPDDEMEQAPSGKGRGHWWRILMQDGCKPFMVGVLYEGLKRYHRLTGDDTCIEIFRKSLDWLIDKMWYPLRGTFEYEFNAFNASHRDSFPHYINLIVVDGFAYAYRLTGEKRYLQIGSQAFHSALWTLPGLIGGKELGMTCRSSLDFLALLSDVRRSEAQAPAGVLALPDSTRIDLTIVPQREWPKRPNEPVKTLLSVAFDDVTELQLDGNIEIGSDGLHAVRSSIVTFPAEGNVSEIAGTCQLRFRPDWHGDTHGSPYPRALMHIQGEAFTKDALSLIAFYNGLHLRVYGPDRRLSGVIETDITTWTPDFWHDIAFMYGNGEAKLFVDGKCVGETALRCPFSGKFELIRVGHRPGFWFADGWIQALKILDR